MSTNNLSPEMQEKIRKLQILDSQIQNIHVQLDSIQRALSENTLTLKELV